jgi:predicted secreted protein
MRPARTTLGASLIALAAAAAIWMALPTNQVEASRAATATAAAGLQIECESAATHVKSITIPDYTPVSAAFQFPPGNMELLMNTTVTVGGKGESCLAANFSAISRVTDNYIVYQVRVDGVPMFGHLSGMIGIATPVVVESKYSTEPDTDRMTAHNFFAKVSPGTHRIEVLVAAGSGINPAEIPYVGSPVLTLHYKGN